MSQLEECNYSYNELAQLWNSDNNTKKQENELDNLYDLACERNPSEMGMVGFEFKNTKQLNKALKKNRKQTGGLKLSKDDRLQVKLMSQLEECNYSYNELAQLWNSDNNNKKQEDELDNLYDLACERNPSEMGMVGFEFKNTKQLNKALKKNRKQTGGVKLSKDDRLQVKLMSELEE